MIAKILVGGLVFVASFALTLTVLTSALALLIGVFK